MRLRAVSVASPCAPQCDELLQPRNAHHKAALTQARMIGAAPSSSSLRHRTARLCSASTPAGTQSNNSPRVPCFKRPRAPHIGRHSALADRVPVSRGDEAMAHAGDPASHCTRSSGPPGNTSVRSQSLPRRGTTRACTSNFAARVSSSEVQGDSRNRSGRPAGVTMRDAIRHVRRVLRHGHRL